MPATSIWNMLLFIALLAAGAAIAQEPAFVMPAAAGTFVVQKDVSYRPERLMDVYRPAKAGATPAPVLIFLNTVGRSFRDHFFYQGWAKAAAANGIVGLVPDAATDQLGPDLDALLEYLAKNRAALGIDPDRVATYGGSANVYRGMSLVQDPKRTGIKAAVFYYGSTNVTRFRTDLPVLFVRAGLDRPDLNKHAGTV